MADFRKLTEAIFIDVETTGVNSKKDRVVSLALAKVDFDKIGEDADGKVRLSYDLTDYVFDPEIPIPAGASRVNGFTDDMVKGKPKFADKAREIRDFIGDLPIVAHNVEFDGTLLDAEFTRAGVETIPTKRGHRWCTMMEAHRRACLIFGEDVKWPKLAESGPYAGVNFTQSITHDATEDVINTIKLAMGFRNTRVKNGQLEDFREVKSLAPHQAPNTTVPPSYKPAWPEEKRMRQTLETPKRTRKGWIIVALCAAMIILVVLFA